MATGLGGSFFYGPAGAGAFGLRVVSVGDLTGDGRADLAVAAPLEDSGGLVSSGAVYVIHGTAGADGYPATVLLNAGGASGVPYSVIIGGPESGRLGTGLAAGGDINGDGRADLLLGAPGPETADGRAFAIYVPLGGLPPVLDLGTLSAGDGTQFTTRPGTGAGASVAGLGDVDGDGLDDLAVTSPGDGRAYILLGDGAAHPVALNLNGEFDTQRILFTGIDRFVSAAGDVNDDGIGDIVLQRSAEAGGGIVVVFGSSTLAGATLNLGTFVPDGANGFAIAAEGNGVAASPGDIDGDGIADLLVQDVRGVVLVRGRADDFAAMIDPIALAPGQGTRFIGAGGALDMGGTGDVNGDGWRDLVLVQSSMSVGDGALYVVFGKQGGLPDEIDLMTLDSTTGYRIAGSGAGDAIGAARLVDMNGDGFADIAAGLSARNDGAGALAVIYGGPRRMAAFDGADGAVDGRIDLAFLGDTYSFTEPEPVPLGGGTGQGGPTSGSDDLLGTGGIDVIDLLAGNDTYAALAGDDSILGGDGADLVFADSGNDRVFGGTGADTLDGMAGNDHLDGGAGTDRLVGGTGNDTLCADRLADVVVEQRFGGIDWLFASVTRSLPREIEHLRLTGVEAIGGRGNGSGNAIVGNAAANRLEGLAGNDTLAARAGADTIIGGAGKDRLSGGADGAADRFVFAAVADSVAGRLRDVVLGFERGHDRIDLRLLDADAIRGGSQDLAFRGAKAQAHSVWFVETVNGLRLLADTTGDLRPEFEVRMDDVFRLMPADLLL